MIEIGMTHTVEKTVTADMTAKAVGSGGLEVLGTPYMMGLMECAAMWCVQNELPEGKGTVGVDIASSHLAPTPVGMKISATAEVTGVSANGKMISFKITASDEDGLIGEGTHTRAIIDNARFMQKCSDKLHKTKKHAQGRAAPGGGLFCIHRRCACTGAGSFTPRVGPFAPRLLRRDIVSATIYRLRTQGETAWKGESICVYWLPWRSPSRQGYFWCWCCRGAAGICGRRQASACWR